MNIHTSLLNFLNEQKINEGASDILYHFTYTDYLLNILKDNEFSLTSALGSSSDYNINKKKYFYFSTTRSRSTGFKKGNVKIVLDGRKIKNNNKITPVDYWAWSKDRKDYGDNNSYINALQSTEQEDRIVSDKATIPNAMNYIKEIHILSDKYQINKNLKQIIDICKENNIVLFIYDKEKNWLNQVKPISNDIEFDINNDNDTNEYTIRDNFDYDIASLIAYNDLNNYNTIKNYLDNDEAKIKKLDDTLNKRTVNNFRIGSLNFDDGINYLEASLKNIRSNSDKNSKFLLLFLVKEFKKYKVQTVKDYILKKQFINKKTLNDYKKDLKQFLVNTMMNDYMDGLDRYFNSYIEVDGNYYNNAYDCEELIKVIYSYIKKIKEYLDKVIFSDDDIFKYSYLLGSDYIEKYIGLNNIKLSEIINITDSREDIEDIDKNFKELISLYIINGIDSSYYNKIKSLKEEYQKNIED